MAGSAGCSFCVEYVIEEAHYFPDSLFRNCVDEFYMYPDFRIAESGRFYEKFSRNKWRRLVPANEMCVSLNSLHILKHLGYMSMIAAADEANIS